MQVNDQAIFTISGKPEQCRILEIRACGTVDVERLSDGQCFRISGLPVANRPSLKFIDAEDVPISSVGVVITPDD